jgi:CheY-like chemotaxis protein
MERILVLDDDLSNLGAISSVLRFLGYRVAEASTAKEALAICQQPADPVNLLVSDVRLRDMSGTELALRLPQSRPELPILFISGMSILEWPSTDQANFRWLSAKRVISFLEKPFRASTLASRVRELLQQMHLRPLNSEPS